MSTIRLLLLLVSIHGIAAQLGPNDFEDASNIDKLKIFYGDETQIGEFPFMVRITGPLSEGGHGHWCGGALIQPRVVLTAAHCAVYMNVVEREIKVTVGDWDEMEVEAVETEHEIARVIVHAGYQDLEFKDDVALLVLKEEVQYKEGVGPIALPEDRTLYETGTPITVIGWGGTEHGGLSEVLLKHEYEMSDQEACKAWWDEQQLPILEGNVCTGKPPLEGHAWGGDSGGPLFTKQGDKFVLLALTSWGVTEPTPDAYDVNTDVFFYLDWINKNLERAFDDKWIDFEGELNNGVVRFHDKEEVHTVCNAGVTKDEIDAICRNLGYSYGFMKQSEQYQTRRRKVVEPELPPIGVTNFKCNSGTEDVFKDCSSKVYPDEATQPCFRGQELAVHCTDTESEWDFEVKVMKTNLKQVGDIVKGKVECYADAKQYGTLIDYKSKLQGALVNVNEDGVEVVAERMKLKKWEMKFMHKVKRQDEVKHNCFVCVISLQETYKFYAAKVEVDDCRMDSVEALRAVNEWMGSREEETGWD